jgi:hypothetical protein
MQKDRDATDDFDPYADDPLFTAEQAAEYCKISVTKINELRREKKLPNIRTISDARYRRSDINKLNNNHVSWGWMELK